MSREQKHDNRGLVAVLSVLCVVILGLIIAVVVLAFLQNNTEAPSEELYDYSYYYDAAVEIMNDDTEKTRSEEAIDYAKKADELAKTEDSAVLVMNIASFYGLSDVYDEYAEILRIRQIEMGIDPETESEG